MRASRFRCREPNILFLFVLQTVNIKAKPLITKPPSLSLLYQLIFILSLRDDARLSAFCGVITESHRRSTCTAAAVYWSASRPLHINYLHIIAHKRAASEREREANCGETVSMWNLAGGVCAVHRRACELFERCCWAASLQPHHVPDWKTASTQQNQQREGERQHRRPSSEYIWKYHRNSVKTSEKHELSWKHVPPRTSFTKRFLRSACRDFWGNKNTI